MKSWHKAIWIGLVIVLLIIELYAIKARQDAWAREDKGTIDGVNGMYSSPFDSTSSATSSTDSGTSAFSGFSGIQLGTYWIHTKGPIDERDRCVSRINGEILIEAEYARATVSEELPKDSGHYVISYIADEWLVFEHNELLGQYVTEQDAINAAIKRRPECANNDQIIIK